MVLVARSMGFFGGDFEGGAKSQKLVAGSSNSLRFFTQPLLIAGYPKNPELRSRKDHRRNFRR